MAKVALPNPLTEFGVVSLFSNDNGQLDISYPVFPFHSTRFITHRNLVFFWY